MGVKVEESGSMKLLLVEDNIENAKLIIRILNTDGYDVAHTVSGLEGLSIARNEAFDAILLDFDLPDIDGSQVGLSLRKRLPNTPLIAVTAHADKLTRSKAKLFGFNAFISKPFTDDDLLNTLHELIDANSTESGTRS
jgi:two-component system, sensor histidine kinase and response regulator